MARDSSVPLSPIQILCAADRAFAAPLCAMLTSVLDHHPVNREIIIYVLATQIPIDERQLIGDSLTTNFPNFPKSSLHWLSPGREMINDLPISQHINLEAYSRLLAPFVLPEDCTRVLYLDSDVIVLSDLSELYDSPENGNAIHAARDLGVGKVSAPNGVFNFKELGISPNNYCFNSGVFLMHLEKWRKEKIAERVLDYMRQHKDAVHFWDQGGMNAILHDAWAEVDPAWNQTRAVIYPEFWQAQGFSKTKWRQVADHPKIIHYTGGDKPWNNVNDFFARPGYSYFFKYLDRTPYRKALKGPHLERYIGYHSYFYFWQVMRNIYQFGKSRRAIFG